jgi:hypothetical protein
MTPDESVSEHKQGDLIGYARISISACGLPAPPNKSFGRVM